MARRNVFCIEGDWWNDVKNPWTVKPALELVRQVHKPFKYIHRTVATRPEFDHLLNIWVQRRHSDYPLLYLAFHGERQQLIIGDHRRSDSRVKLDDIASVLESRCNNRMLHFGSCETFSCDRRHLKRFLRKTGASAVTGYREAVDWLDSSLFEIQLIGSLQYHTVSRQGLPAVRRDIMDRIGKVARSLGFLMVTKWD